MGKRDDFTASTTKNLGLRVGHRCSNPDCGKPTAGPHTDPNKHVISGVAAHITAAASGGPRYNSSLDTSERKSINNGIWLCVNCSTLIDRDEKKYPEELLRQWKQNAETIADEALRKNVISITKSDEQVPNLVLDLQWAMKGKKPLWVSSRNHEVYGNDPIPVGGNLITMNQLTWDYDLVIYNQSSFPAYDIRISEDGPFPNFSFLEKLPTINNIPHLKEKKLKAKFTKRFEGNGKEAEEMIKPDFPQEFEGKKVILKYKNEAGKSFYTEATISNNGIENQQIPKPD